MLTKQEGKAIEELIATLTHKLALAKTCSAGHKGTNKKYQDSLVLQVNTIYKLAGVDYKIS